MCVRACVRACVRVHASVIPFQLLRLGPLSRSSSDGVPFNLNTHNADYVDSELVAAVEMTIKPHPPRHSFLLGFNVHRNPLRFLGGGGVGG